jgi:hypothetical protein
MTVHYCDYGMMCDNYGIDDDEDVVPTEDEEESE